MHFGGPTKLHRKSGFGLHPLRNLTASKRAVCGSPGGSDHSSLHELHIERDGHLVANENAAAFERCVPGQAEVFATDLRGR
jgi:hypothetical protein